MRLFSTIRTKLICSILLLAAAAVLSAGYDLYRMAEFNRTHRELVEHNVPRILACNEALIDRLEAIRFLKNAIIVSNDADREKYIAQNHAYLDKFHQALDRWESVASGPDREQLKIIREEVADYEKINQRIMELAHNGQLAEAQSISLSGGIELSKKIQAQLHDAAGRGLEELNAGQARSEESSRNAGFSILLVALVGTGAGALLAGLLIFAVTRRICYVRDHVRDVAHGEGDLTRRLHITRDDEIGEMGVQLNFFLDELEKIVCEVVAEANDIAAASEELSSTAAQISRNSAAQREETLSVAAAIQEMAATVLEVSNNSSQASTSAQQAEEVARGGGEIVRSTVATIRALAEQTRDSSSHIQELGSASHQIGRIIGVIDDIADQTNLLALNAAIEAARAGEQGRGFAVVADEVRKLAERTSSATHEITGMVTSIQSGTQSAVQAMNNSSSRVEAGVKDAMEAGSALERIITSAGEVQQVVLQIATAAHEQSSTTEQVAQNMDRIAQMVEQSFSAAEESARAVQGLSGQARKLQSLVAQFKVGRVASHAAPPPMLESYISAVQPHGGHLQ
jgi:methyl-accepting chemotaxis protein